MAVPNCPLARPVSCAARSWAALFSLPLALAAACHGPSPVRAAPTAELLPGRPPAPAAGPLESAAPPNGSANGFARAAAVGDDGASTLGPRANRLRLVLDRQARLLSVVENDQERRRFSVAVGMAGWETPVGEFQVLEKTRDPIWEHPQSGRLHLAGPSNPLGSRWIGFFRDCRGRKGWDGEQTLDIKGCVVAGFHGTPHRWTVGRAVSHGCVRLYDEDVRELFELVSIGTPVTVLP